MHMCMKVKDRVKYSDTQNPFLISLRYLEYPENTGYSLYILRYSESVFDFLSILRIPRKYWVFSFYSQNSPKILCILFWYSDTQIKELILDILLFQHFSLISYIFLLSLCKRFLKRRIASRTLAHINTSVFPYTFL